MVDIFVRPKRRRKGSVVVLTSLPSNCPIHTVGNQQVDFKFPQYFGIDLLSGGPLTRWMSILDFDNCMMIKANNNNLSISVRIPCRFCSVTDHPVISVSAGNNFNRCKLTRDRTRCDVTEGEAVNIRCHSHSNPDPASTRWYKGHPDSAAGADSVLLVTSASHVTDNGVYSCQSVTGDLSYSHPPLTSTYNLTVLVKCELFLQICFS